VLLLDEPLSNLDARLRLDMRSELQRLQRDTGLTMIFVTHDQSEALALSDRIVLMKEGKIEQLGTPDQLYRRPASVFAADFVGFENIFRITERDVKGCCISNGVRSLPLHGSAEGTHLAWRPAAVAVGQGKHQGIVQSVAFAGEQREYAIETDIGLIKAIAPADETAYSIGDRVRFDMRVDKALVLDDD
jgi:putative spermidine/putrescine transport system ATP-binding protein